jgi:hypothetical protein
MNQQPPDVPSQAPTDSSGWAQPPAPEGPTGAFVDRPPIDSRQPLPPGAGAPLQPGPPVSVEAPIRDRTYNLAALALTIGIAIVVIIVVVAVVLLVGALLARGR